MAVFKCKMCRADLNIEYGATVVVCKYCDTLQTVPVVQDVVNNYSLLQRAFMFLNDEEWSSAEEYFQKVLDIEPKNADAYLGLALAQNKKSTKYAFAEAYIQGSIKTDDKNLKRAGQFANEQLKTWLKEIDVKRAEKEKHRVEKRNLLARARERASKYRNILSTGNHSTVGLKADGTVVAAGTHLEGGEYFIQYNVSDWKDIIAVSAADNFIVGLKADGRVVAKGSKSSVYDWKDIIAVSVGELHTVGLKADGRVVAEGRNFCGACNVSDWKDIIAVSAGKRHTVGLKADGTVVAVGSNENYDRNYVGQCNVSGWKDIIAVLAGDYHTVGIKADGTVVAVGENGQGQCDVDDWKDIIAVSVGERHTVGLKADGTVVAVGENGLGQCDVDDWKDIIAVSVGERHTVGLKADGTVDIVGSAIFGEDKVRRWRDIIAVSASGSHIVGLKTDGTVVAVGSNTWYECNVGGWKLFKSEKELEKDYSEACRLQNSANEADLKKAYIMFSSLKDYLDSKTRADICEKAYKEKKAIRWERERTERAARKERERRERAMAQEAERQKKTAMLNNEKNDLQTEYANLKGLFSGRRRREIEARLAQIEYELKNI